MRQMKKKISSLGIPWILIISEKIETREITESSGRNYGKVCRVNERCAVRRTVYIISALPGGETRENSAHKHTN